MADPTATSAAPTPGHVVQTLSAVARAERQFARAVAREMAIAATDLLALGELLHADSVGVLELGRRLGLGSAAATGLADRLELAGYLVRTPHGSDRRRTVLRATDDARDALLGNLRPVTERLRDLAASLDEDERRTVARFLDGVVEQYERSAATRADPREG